MVLREYMARMDGDDPRAALDVMEPDIRFLFALPAGDVTGQSTADFARYIAGRPAVRRTHEVLRAAVDGDTEMVYGVVTDDGVVTGAFHALALVSPNGKLAAYQVYFTTEFQVLTP